MALGLLLASDILLPIPSSLASTACGLLFGVVTGAAISLADMTVSCVLGYWLGAVCGRSLIGRWVGCEDLARLDALTARAGDWAVVVARPVPVLAEASVLVAGIGGMPFRRFLVLSGLANLGISVIYAVAGAFAATTHSFLLAVLAAIAVPWLAMRGLPRRSV